MQAQDYSGTTTVGLCECGHPVAEHAESGWGENTVCVEKLPTFPEGGWHGVCSCVRREVEGDAARPVVKG